MEVIPISDIVAIVKDKQLIKDDFVRGGKFFFDNRGRLKYYSGGFTVAFPCVVNGEKWAFRCWRNFLSSESERYQKLSDILRTNSLQYFSEFKYVDQGVVVNGKCYPTTIMRWIEGKNIKDYICDNSKNPTVLKKLAQDFLNMCKTLHKHQYAHGDLQHGNIIVDDSGNLFLIDYDSLYHPQMGTCNDIIKGLLDYQHPKRKENKYASEKLDYFSELIIFICILAVSDFPQLVEEYKLREADNMLFCNQDYSDLKSSKLYQFLLDKGGIYSDLLRMLEEYLSHNDINELQPFDIVPPEIKEFSVSDNLVYEGESITLTWNVQHAVRQSINDTEIDLSKCTFTDEVKSDKIYILKVSNIIGTVSKQVKVEVVKQPSIEFSSSKSRLRKGQNESTILTWNVCNAKSVAIIDGNKKVLSKEICGNKVISPCEKETYTAEVVGLDGVKKFYHAVTVEVDYESVVSFECNRNYTLPSVPVMIKWNVQYADKVAFAMSKTDTFTFEEVKEDGTMVITPTERTTVVLKVKDKFEEKDYKLVIEILPLPIIKSIQVPGPKIEQEINLHINPAKFKVIAPLPQMLSPKVIPFVPKVILPMMNLGIQPPEKVIPFITKVRLPMMNLSIQPPEMHFPDLSCESKNKGVIKMGWEELVNNMKQLYEELKQTIK